MGTLKSEYNFPIKLPQEKTFHQFLLSRVEGHVQKGRKEWLRDYKTGRIIYFSDVEPLSRKCASYFSRGGLRKGQTVIYTTHDTCLLHLLNLGVWRANGIVRSCYSEEKPETILEYAKESQASFIICDGDTAQKLGNVMDLRGVTDIDLIVVRDYRADLGNRCISVEEVFKDDGTQLPECQLASDDIALVLPTSGTTGKSKGAASSHSALITRALIYEYHPLTNSPSTPPIIFGKPTHSTGSTLPFYHLASGCYIVTSNYSEEALLSAVTEFEGLFCVSPLLAPLLHQPHDRIKVKHFFFCGAIAKPELFRRLKLIPSVQTIVNILGMSETSMLCTTAKLNPERKIQIWPNVPDESVGKILPFTEVQIRDIESGSPLPRGSRGEICFKSPYLFSGYVNNKQDTENTLKDGWLITGDYGYLDENGFLFISDRIKDTFLCHLGNHISPSDIEAILRKHPCVEEAAVVPFPFEQVGDPRAFILLKKGAERYPGLEDEIQDFAHSQLAEYQYLKGGVFILEEFPKGSSGKVLKRLLGKMDMLNNNYIISNSES